MSLLIGFLTFILVVNCLFLILLVLVQLPKKEAGAGLAFAAGAVDTLIGAGSGNALTKLTRYGASSFIGLAVILAVLNAQRSQTSSRNLERALSEKSSAAPAFNLPPAGTPTTGALSNNPVATTVTPSTNAAPAQGTNAAAPVIQLNPTTPNAEAPTIQLQPVPNAAAPAQPAPQPPQ
jgi:protein translocase SecG subunit